MPEWLAEGAITTAGLLKASAFLRETPRQDNWRGTASLYAAFFDLPTAFTVALVAEARLASAVSTACLVALLMFS